MKVGVLTFHRGPNYGGFLQAYCLKEVIARLGHEVEVINYQNRAHHASEKLHPWVYRRPNRLWHDFLKLRSFRRALPELSLSPFTTDPGQVNWNAYDAIVVGSDIVWNCQDPRLGQDPVYFGRFPTAFDGRLIAYAPSVGSMPATHPAPTWVSEGLRRFHAIRVRDEVTRQFLRHQTGQETSLVADPTWLLDDEKPDGSIKRLREADDYLLVYSLRLEGERARAIRDFATRNRLRTVAPGYFQSWADINLASLDPFQWADLFRRAKYAVVGTFHGGLYCIRENLQFAVAGHPSIDSKLATPLALTGLSNRRIELWENLATLLKDPIDHEQVRLVRQTYAKESLAFLEEALSR